MPLRPRVARRCSSGHNWLKVVNTKIALPVCNVKLTVNPGIKKSMKGNVMTTAVEMVTVNGYPAVKTRLTVRNGAFFTSQSVATARPSDEFAWLMGLLEGRDVEAIAFSGTNLSGHTTEAELREAFTTMNPENRLWIKEPQLEAVIAKFGDGKLGFHMGGMYCEQTPAEIEALIATAKRECGETSENDQAGKSRSLRM